jgi:hypothetical protein
LDLRDLGGHHYESPRLFGSWKNFMARDPHVDPDKQ